MGAAQEVAGWTQAGDCCCSGPSPVRARVQRRAHPRVPPLPSPSHTSLLLLAPFHPHGNCPTCCFSCPLAFWGPCISVQDSLLALCSELTNGQPQGTLWVPRSHGDLLVHKASAFPAVLTSGLLLFFPSGPNRSFSSTLSFVCLFRLLHTCSTFPRN